MTRSAARHRQSDGGFTMIEALVAIALMGVILAALATLTAQWLPSWNRGLLRAQSNEQIAIALDRLAADLSAAEFVAANRTNKRPLFDGGELSVTFVRSAIGPNIGPGLEIVRIAETADSRGPALVRTRARFVPLPTGNALLDPIPFADPVVLLRAPLRLTFAYASRDGVWQPTWQGSDMLPAAVRFIVRNAVAERILAVSTATPVHVDIPAPEPEQADADEGRPGVPGQPGNPPGSG